MNKQILILGVPIVSQVSGNVETTYTLHRECKGEGGLFELYLTWRGDSFYITGDFAGVTGPIHPDIQKHWPEFAHLTKWHMVNLRGPHYYNENTTYLVQEGNLEGARAVAVWPEATDEELKAPLGDLINALNKRLPALLERFYTDMRAIGFVKENI